MPTLACRLRLAPAAVPFASCARCKGITRAAYAIDVHEGNPDTAEAAVLRHIGFSVCDQTLAGIWRALSLS